jgi:hypothetical protein
MMEAEALATRAAPLQAQQQELAAAARITSAALPARVVPARVASTRAALRAKAAAKQAAPVPEMPARAAPGKARTDARASALRVRIAFLVAPRPE